MTEAIACAVGPTSGCRGAASGSPGVAPSAPRIARHASIAAARVSLVASGTRAARIDSSRFSMVISSGGLLGRKRSWALDDRLHPVGHLWFGVDGSEAVIGGPLH